MISPDPDLMAAQPEQMLAAAAVYDAAAHVVNSVGTATGQASGRLLAEWKGRGAEGFAARVNYLATATPDRAQGLAAVATALRTLAPKISQAQGLLRQATNLRDQAATALDAVHHSSNLAAIHAQAAADDTTTADAMTAQANAMAAEAWQAASAAFDAITGTSPTVKTATLTSATKSTEPAGQPHDRRPKVSPDQVKLITQPDGQRVYSFDGGLKIPADLPGAHHFVEEIKAYMPRFLAGHHGSIPIPPRLSAKHLWFVAAYDYATTTTGEIPRAVRDVFFTERFAKNTLEMLAIMGLLEAIGAGGVYVFRHLPNGPQLAYANGADPSDRTPTDTKSVRDNTPTSGNTPATPNQITNEQTNQANQTLATDDFIPPRTYLNRHGQLTNGTYTVNDQAMAPHQSGSFAAGKSQFFSWVDSDKAVLDAAAYADKYRLWKLDKATVPVTDGDVGAIGRNGQPTSYINVYRTATGFVHGSPGTGKGR